MRIERNHTEVRDELHHFYPNDEIQEWHCEFGGSIQWRVTPEGVEIEGQGLQRTKGEPTTMRRLKQNFGEDIDFISQDLAVPPELIYATIATESGGRSRARREEPGYVSDVETPHRVSIGLMQTLISTAIESLQRETNHLWTAEELSESLKDPFVSIQAGTAYIRQQEGRTDFDPPLVAAAYNAGGVYVQTGEKNRWRLRQYPIGTGKHCDRFVKWYGDALAVLNER